MILKPSSRYNYLFLWFFLTLTSGPAIALDSDRSKPINVEADKANIDDKRGISTYTGNVIVTQGSIRITSDVLTLYSKNQSIEKIIATGNPATYKQRPEGKENDVHAQGQKIKYFTKTDTAIFINNAILKQNGNTFKSNHITYDIANDKVNAGATKGGQRVTITIQPTTEKSGQPLPKPATPEKVKPQTQGPQPSIQKKPLPK